MSIFSNILKKAFKVPEVDVNSLPLGSLLVDHLMKHGVKEVFKPLSDNDIKIIDKAIQIELYHRKTRAGIGMAYDSKSD